MDHLQSRLEAVEQRAHMVERQLRWWRGLACGLVVLSLLSWALPSGTAQEDTVAGSGKEKKGLAHRVAALEDLLRHFSRNGNEVRITGANLRLVNGLGGTDCTDEQFEEIPDCPNGLGNLIVGYNEPREEGEENIRTGSHNVVVGMQHNFSRFGGIVVGERNEISGDFASVSGGRAHTASGIWSSVSGGQNSTASGFISSVSGGSSNTASGSNSSVSGGSRNTASGDGATVSGGGENTASGLNSSVSGGVGNTASGDSAVVSGGQDNTASGEAASAVSGGANNTASGNFAAVSGGENNTASSSNSSVSGGLEITQETEGGWAAGSFGGEVSGSFRSP